MRCEGRVGGDARGVRYVIDVVFGEGVEDEVGAELQEVECYRGSLRLFTEESWSFGSLTGGRDANGVTMTYAMSDDIYHLQNHCK